MRPKLRRSVSASAKLDQMTEKRAHLSVPEFRRGSRETSRSNGSRLSSAHYYTKRLSHAMIEVPAYHVKKIVETQNLGSYQREVQHFSETTTMHGPKRVYRGKRWSFFFWLFIFTASILFLSVQVYSLLLMYWGKPTVSQVFFQIQDEGVPFPVITICPFNPLKKSSINKLNKTGDFSEDLLSYILETNVEAPALYSSSNKQELERGERLLADYKAKHSNFNLYNFFKDYGFKCTDLLRWCSFGGRTFDCCSIATDRLTTIGLCQTLNVNRSQFEWMKHQKAPGVNAGLQLILDSQQAEQFDSDDDDSGVVSPTFESGFRYYIHDNNTVPYLASEGISVSPGMRVYSALTHSRYYLLDMENWGHCIDKFPSQYYMEMEYSAASCSARCKAEYFNSMCNCSPSAYDVDDRHKVCSPWQVVDCMDKHMKKDKNSDFELPSCDECKIECSSHIYQTFNSYGQEFSATSLRWLHKKNANWTTSYVKKNFLTINVFFRDLSFTEYRQVKATSLTELLSSIGGNMGMFLGMSTITITEISLFLCKFLWICISKRRKKYMEEKKRREEDAHKDVEETVKEFKRIRSCGDLSRIYPLEHKDPKQFVISTPELSIDSFNCAISVYDPDGSQKSNHSDDGKK